MPMLTWKVNSEPDREYQEWYARQRGQLKQKGYYVCAAAKVVAVGAKREKKRNRFERNLGGRIPAMGYKGVDEEEARI